MVQMTERPVSASRFSASITRDAAGASSPVEMETAHEKEVRHTTASFVVMMMMTEMTLIIMLVDGADDGAARQCQSLQRQHHTRHKRGERGGGQGMTLCDRG
jgi:hypothetical protein